MHLKFARSILAGLAALMLLSACGKNSGGPQSPVNVFPKANAGSAQAVISGATVTLNGSASNDPDGNITAYSWTQTAGPAVTMSSTTVVQPTFVAPAVTSAVLLRFSLVVTDNAGAKSSAATVAVTVSSGGAGVVTLTGQVRFERVPFFGLPSPGLNYAAPVLQPAREVALRVLDAGSLAELATGFTNASGAYSFSLPGNANVVIQVVARMQRDATPGPRWNVRVQNGTGSLAPYTYNSGTFNTSVGAQDIDIPTGILPSGAPAAQNPRASGPFAILDTIYTAMQAVEAAAPNTLFPALYVNWGSQTGGTFFSPSGQYIALLADLTEDTDEFDQHVVAHEFGHYLENNFSRSDSIGGPHGLGDRLDMRVAFGEGFGYAFAAIVLDNPLALDSFVNGGTHSASGFNVETNPPGGSSGAGCWCSETSVWSILWDLHDVSVVPDSPDNISIGFAPIWQVMTGTQKDTPAMTSIFSFAAALKAARPGDAAGIDALLAAQNIDVAGIDAFATMQMSAPFSNMLPLYRTITAGVPVDVGNSGTRTPARLYNKAGNRSFLRFVPAATGAVNISVVTSNTNVAPAAADPDFLVYRNGSLVALEFDSPQEEPVRTETGTLNVQAGQTYIIEAYDCANGCEAEPVQGIAGDYTLTVTIN
ncbi:MAG: PKD domain-containing protein [Pseudomonadota bacterium]|nr:PKD domain-containing protein [Pseudomonadota bacterium]